MRREADYATLWSLAAFLATATWCVTVAAPITALAFHPLERTLVVGHPGALGVRRSLELTNETRIQSGLKRINALGFDPEAKWLAVVGGEPGGAGGIEFHDWPIGGGAAGEPRRIMATNSDLMMSMAVSPDGRTVAYGGMDRIIRLVRNEVGVRRFEQHALLSGHSGPVLALAFHPGGRWLVSAGVDRTLRVWELASGREVRSLTHHTDSVTSLVFFGAPGTTSDALGRWYCASGSVDGTIRVWQPEIGRMIRTIRRGESGVLALAGRPSIVGFWSVGTDGVIRQYGAEDDVVVKERRVSGDWVYAMTLSPRGGEIATGDWAGTVRVTEMEP